MKQLFLNILFIFVCNSTFAQVDWVHYADSIEQISLHHDLDYQATEVSHPLKGGFRM